MGSYNKSDENAIEITNLYKTFQSETGEVHALKDINFNIKKGEFLSIVGASGCGKSTLLRIISGLETQTKGEIKCNGKLVSEPGLERGMAFQESRLFPWFTLERNVHFGISYEKKQALSKKQQMELVYQYLELVGLADFGKSYPNQLSGGMQQRASIARALIEDPEILLLDEPFGALDAMTRVSMQEELERIWHQQKKTMILVTHDIEEAVYLGDRVVILSSRPGCIKRIVNVDIPKPRFRSSGEFVAIKRSITAEFFNEQNLTDDYVI